MIYYEDLTGKCSLDGKDYEGKPVDGCGALEVKNCDGCPFYKPEGCEDWVRVDRAGAIYPMEEYLETFSPDENRIVGHKWEIIRKPVYAKEL